MTDIEKLEEQYLQKKKAEKEQDKLLGLIKKQNDLYKSKLKECEKEQEKLNKLVSKFESFNDKKTQNAEDENV